MSINDKLREMLIANGITKEFSDDELNAFISEAKMLINVDVVEDTSYSDFKPNFKGRSYVTNFYPLKSTENTVIYLNDEEIIPKYISPYGVIYFDKKMVGDLRCEYVVGLNEEETEKYLIPITLYLIKENNGKNITSVSEGDIHITYGNISDQQILNLINELKNSYSARVRLG